ncbi:MAG: potassium transporter Kup [Rhodoplanes sp.]|uniref:potassium transporter Kup n=1 Tax=Rhodoplanes sp. TaxID=1968906 RepID=UPI00183C6091|nr:potassium transporter Kup [Rhodoplanes sp.]NVO14455.1 potassium transporter Kup [Rhodoplanes sp.]
MASRRTSKNMNGLVLGAIGVVFGDIGTSPLYALKETFAGRHALEVEPASVLGVVSLMFWTIMVLVTVKYVAIIMRADNRGEGGSLALLALVTDLTKKSRLASVVTALGIFAAALFYGDSMITPAISVLSAVEGLEIVAPELKTYVIPITIGVLCGLFWIQRRGTELIGILFGPIMCVWFAVLAVLGIVNILHDPTVIAALNPLYGAELIIRHPWQSFLALGAIFLAVTGGEALYADMGHFGRVPIRLAWFALVLPALVLNYFGQAALILHDPTTLENPFYRLAPDWLLLPLVVLATAATVIASQAVISGAFSVAHQAVQLGYLPRMEIKHTSSSEAGQIYVPFTNWTLFFAVIGLVVFFQSSSNLAAAYGIAVAGTMIISTIMISFVAVKVWKWPKWVALPLLGTLLLIDTLFLASNTIKIGQGGWFALAIAATSFITLTTWKRGRVLLLDAMANKTMPLDEFLRIKEPSVLRVKNTAVYLTSRPEGVPSALLHNLKHNQILHERNVLVTVATAEIPFLEETDRTTVTNLGKGFFRILVRYGFMERPDIPAALRDVSEHGLDFDLERTTFFVSREIVLPRLPPGMAVWRELFFSWMMRNAVSATDFFRIPPERVVELGTQVEI